MTAEFMTVQVPTEGVLVFYVCRSCGAMVFDVKQHGSWHKKRKTK